MALESHCNSGTGLRRKSLCTFDREVFQHEGAFAQQSCSPLFYKLVDKENKLRWGLSLIGMGKQWITICRRFHGPIIYLNVSFHRCIYENMMLECLIFIYPTHGIRPPCSFSPCLAHK